MCFISGLLFAITEFIFAIYSHSQSALTDAVYDASELVFIALLLFLTPLFHKPISEKHPYGYFQVESIFVIIKNVMMLSVTELEAASEILNEKTKEKYHECTCELLLAPGKFKETTSAISCILSRQFSKRNL